MDKRQRGWRTVQRETVPTIWPRFPLDLHISWGLFYFFFFFGGAAAFFADFCFLAMWRYCHTWYRKAIQSWVCAGSRSVFRGKIQADLNRNVALLLHFLSYLTHEVRR